MARRLRGPALLTSLLLVLGGCTQTGGDLGIPAAAVVPPGSPPLALDAGPADAGAATTAAADGKSVPTANPTPVAQAPPTPAPPPSPASANPASIAAAGSPIPPAAAGDNVPPAAGGVAPAPTASAFPNINVPPSRPEGTLLPPEERSRVIEELEALRARQATTLPDPGASANELREAAKTHGAAAIHQIEECAEDGTDDPECQSSE